MEKLLWLSETVRSANLYIHPPITISPDKSLASAYGYMYDTKMQKMKIRHLIVTHNGKSTGDFEGLISDRDFTLKTDLKTILLSHVNVNEAMTLAGKIICVKLDDTVESVLLKFTTKVGQHRHYISILPVKDDKNENNIYAVISYVDVLRLIRDNQFEVPQISIPYTKYPPEGNNRFYFATPDTEFADVKALIDLDGIRTIPVVDRDKKKILGMITDRKLYDCLMRFDDMERVAFKADNDYLMIPKEELSLVKTGDLIYDTCVKLLEGDKPDALLVSDDGEKLNGIVSYIDIFNLLINKK